MYTFLVLVTVGVVLCASSGAQAACTATGKNVTAEGYLMDNLCIDRGTLFDNPSVISLQQPEVHSIKCLVEVPGCVESGYTILAPPATLGGNYSVEYQLGLEGTALAKTAAETAQQGGQIKGFQLKVAGIDDGTEELKCVSVLSMANSSATAPPPSTNSSATSPSPSPISNATSPAPSPSSSASESQTSLLSTIVFAVVSLLAANFMA